MSRASLSVNVKSVALGIPIPVDDTLDHLTSDTDSAIAIAALRTKAVLKRARLEESFDDDSNTGSHRGKDSGGMKDLPYKSRKTNRARDSTNDWTDDRLNTVTDFLSNILVFIPQLGQPSHMDLEETRMTLDALCRGLNGRAFPHADQQRLVDVLTDIYNAPSALDNAGPTGTICPPVLEHC
jgi:hypothetical protein